MADIKGIELASDIYGLEDEKARDDVETNTSAIGNLANLSTTAKNNLVAAINEIDEKIDDWEDITSQIVRTSLIVSGSMKLLKKGKIIFFQCQNLALAPQGASQNQDLAGGLPPPPLDWLCVPCMGHDGVFRPLAINTDGTLSSTWANQTTSELSGSVMYKAQ